MQRVFNRGAQVLEYGARASMIIMVITVSLQVIMRYVVGRPLMWSEELARFGYAWFAHFGVGLAAREGTHLRVSFLVEHSPPILLKALEVLRYIAEIAFSALLVWQAIKLRTSMGNIKAYSLGVPLWWLIAALIPGFVAYILSSLVKLCQLFTRKECCS